MNNTITVNIEGIGPIVFEESKRAGRLNISIKPHKPVRVAVPSRVSFNKAKELVKSKISWIRKHSSRMKVLEKKYEEKAKTQNPINKIKAGKMLIERLRQLTQKHNFKYNRVFIRNQRTRWGSCSMQNNINLNINLVQLPDRLINYIILHELLHTRIKNHSKHFWTELNKLVGNAKTLNAEVKSYYPWLDK